MVFLQSLRHHPLRVKLGQLVPAKAWERRPGLFFSLCAGTMVSSLLLGGGTRGGFLSDTILELIAIPALLVALSSFVALPWSETKQRAEWPLMLCLAIALLPLVQLIPLPPWLWTKLPQRDEILTTFTLLGRDLPWLPISVSPSSTWVSVLSLLPPFAIFLGVIQLGYRERRAFSLILIGAGVFSAFVGIVQVVQGPSSPLRFFTITSGSEAVGFFANNNHFASFMYMLLPFGAAWATNMAFTIRPGEDRKYLESSSIAKLTGIFLVLIVFVAADAMTRSRAGLGLMIVAIFGVLVLPIADRRRSSGLTKTKLAFGAGLLVIFLLFQFGLYRLSERLAVDPLADARIVFARNTIAAAKAYMPFGSGVGTFVPVYSMFEPLQDTVANFYVNHAHNDWLEIWLEGGVISVILVTAFLVWFLLTSKNIWWRIAVDRPPIDLLLMRAATIAVPLVMAHSFVDYPLRTGAMMAVFAVCCALLIEPLRSTENEMAIAGAPRALARRKAAPSLPAATTGLPNAAAAAPAIGGPTTATSPSPPQAGGRWGEDIDWPDEWRSLGEPKRPGPGKPRTGGDPESDPDPKV